MESDFEHTVNEYIKWGMIIGLVYFSYKNEGVRLLGYVIGSIALIAALYHTFFTVFLSGKYWALALILLGACYFGSVNQVKRKP